MLAFILLITRNSVMVQALEGSIACTIHCESGIWKNWRVSMESSLFRQEALEHRKESGLGPVFVVQPVSQRVYVLVAIAVFAAVASLMVTGTYDRKATVPGHLVSSRGVVHIRPHGAGVVNEVFVKPGQAVGKGEALFAISYERQIATGNRLFEEQIAEINSQIESLMQSEDRIRTAAIFDVDQLKAETSQLEEEIASIARQSTMQTGRLEIALGQLSRYQSLTAKGYFAEVRLQEQKDLVLSHRQSLEALAKERSRAQIALSNTRSRLHEIPAATEDKLAEVDRQVASLKRQLAEADAYRATEYRSPVDGTVSALQVQPGEMVQPAYTLASILPKDSDLLAKLYVPTRSAGFLKAGQAVRIRYAAFPHQRYGSQPGRITHISRTLSLPNELSGSFPAAEPFYQIDVEIEKDTIAGFGAEWPLQIGMQLQADIVMDERRLVDWILAPVLSLRGGTI